MHIKNLVFTLTACLGLSVNAQTQTDITPEMMQNMAEMQNCMMQIDYQEMAQMEQKSMQLESQMRTYCSNGQEDEAKKLALAFSEDVMNSQTMQAMKKCAAMMPGMEDQLKVPDFRQELEQKSICEMINNNPRQAE
ncbi:MAG: hypothetical protein P8Y20_09890 [Gammaproteobacteria bacterium]|jgi:predicted lipoprotein